MFKYNSDQLRYNVIKSAQENPVDEHEFDESELYRGKYLMNAVCTQGGDLHFYEVWSKDAINTLKAKEGYEDLSSVKAIHKFITSRFKVICLKAGFKLNEYDFDGEILVIEANTVDSGNDEVLELLEFDDPTMSVKNQSQRHQNPHKVNLMLKTLFTQKYENQYEINTDAGKWSPVKSLNKDGALFIEWRNEEYKLVLTTWLFPNNSNKIEVEVRNNDSSVKINHYFEIYRIPRTNEEGEYFFEKSFFNLLKKFIDTQVIKMSPVNKEFTFWKSDNPFYPYSFSTPKKNKIINDLIRFINIAKNPKLDTFFTQNNLKHKQGYLQTLLDSAEEAEIFEFVRQGNEIIVKRGNNFKQYTDGKVRRI